VAQVLALLAEADGLIEGYRPGVMERLGLGPAPCAQVNPRLVYGRMTGWGQSGPLAQAAGHDMNYVALTGLMDLAARPGQAPMLPPAVLGDAVGGLGLVTGMLAGLLRSRASGVGCVVDGAIVDVLALLAPLPQMMSMLGSLDRVNPSVCYGSPFYEAYECADGRYITVCAIEPQFYAVLLQRLGLADVDPEAQMDKAAWPALCERLARLFRSRDRQHWQSLLEGTDACFAPVLTLQEAARHPHHVARGLYTVAADGAIETARGLQFTPLAAAAAAA
jgi:alpha-methylacyl-CoA racemase